MNIMLKSNDDLGKVPKAYEILSPPLELYGP